MSRSSANARTGGPGRLPSVPGPGRTLVVVPTYNERDNLPLLAAEVLALDPDLELLVIDDGSPDGTGEVADQLAVAEPRVHVHHRSGKRGLGPAYVEGFQWALAAGYARVAQMDCDFSHRPSDLARLLEVDADVVLGSRYVPGGAVEGWPLTRRVVSRLGSLYARTWLGGGPRDYTGGFKCFRASVLRRLDLDRIRSNGYAFQVEVNYACSQAGYELTEVPIRFPERGRGQSKMSLGIAIEAAILVPALRLGFTHIALRTLPSGR